MEIIKTILDSKNTNNFLDIETIQEIAQEKQIDYILDAIENGNEKDLQDALICYVNNAQEIYGNDTISAIWKNAIALILEAIIMY